MNQIAQFYIICPIGLVAPGLRELKEKWAIHFNHDNELEILSVDEAGILISAPILKGFLLNHILRSPSRILMRVAEFKARDFPKLYQKVAKISWKNILLGHAPSVVASATNSRLFDSRKIEKAIQDGIKESYRKQPVKKKYLEHYDLYVKDNLPQIYYRAVDDQITISLDTTGELLHKRGEKIYTGLAPIRESLATLLTLALTSNLQEGNYALIDPMAGSGTFLIEAHDYLRVNNERGYAYQHTPLWINESQNNLKIESLKNFESPYFRSFSGFEKNSEVITLAKKNIGKRNIQIEMRDLFKDETESLGNNLIITNPPYGVRVGDKNDIDLDYYKKIISMIRIKYKPERIGIIIPEEYKYRPGKEELIEQLPFKNGGLSVVFYVLRGR